MTATEPQNKIKNRPHCFCTNRKWEVPWARDTEFSGVNLVDVPRDDEVEAAVGQQHEDRVQQGVVVVHRGRFGNVAPLGTGSYLAATYIYIYIYIEQGKKEILYLTKQGTDSYVSSNRYIYIEQGRKYFI